ncbi:MAG: peptidoglycan-binding domain-containing protein [Christensenellales bacterium]
MAKSPQLRQPDQEAVRKFQDDNNLTVDGIAGTSTINRCAARRAPAARRAAPARVRP